MLQRMISFFTILVCVFSPVCSVGSQAETAFTDALGRTVVVDDFLRVGVASGSLAECWMLAGGELCAVTRDVQDRNLDLPENVIDLGSLKEPSLEIILASDLDLLMLMPTLKNHIAIAETLDKAGVNYAYFDVEDFGDYLELLKLFTDITGRTDLYEKNGSVLVPRIEAALARAQTEEAARILILRVSSGKSRLWTAVRWSAACWRTSAA